MIVPLYKGKGERTEIKNYRTVRLLSVVEKAYVARTGPLRDIFFYFVPHETTTN